MSKNKIETFSPKSQTDWRNWLEKNHQSKQFVCMIYFKSSTKAPSISWSEAVDEALCFGLIDSTMKTIDEERYMQYFSKRKTNSAWSNINKCSGLGIVLLPNRPTCSCSTYKHHAD